MITEKLSEEVKERFWEKVELIPFHECWEWTSAKNNKGYGIFGLKKNTDKAHRISFRIAKGEIPKGLFILHSCDNPGCVNPSHLRTGTNQDNVSDMISRGRNSKPPDMAGWNKIDLPDELIKRLGSSPDKSLADEFGISKKTVIRARHKRNIPSFASTTGNTGKFAKGMNHPRWGQKARVE